MIENWLLKSEEYEPNDTKERFIDKSIFSFLKIINNIKKEEQGNTYIYKINVTVKMFSIVLNILLITLSRNFLFLGVLNILLLSLLLSIDKSKRLRIMLVSLIFPFFTSIILIPAIIKGNIFHSGLLIYKVFINILLINIISTTATRQAFIKSLKFLLVPDMFIWIMELTLKYILLLGEYSLEVLQALKIKSIGKSRGTKKSLFPIMGNMFLNSVKLSEEMIGAMECRGFTGEYHYKQKVELKSLDYIYILVNMLIVSLFIIIKVYKLK
ncbi:energy-coupling factor transporter transmembrane protein EcfT [Fusobacteria bacterium ZRK30]|nr:energy-coupling factor transporter transmembrane protein EcfT [Fusobacteria bacterium ZRK30]